ncbi:MAG: protein kinase [Prevotella sp.]|nr:protein kinase [Prevotella sp.]
MNDNNDKTKRMTSATPAAHATDSTLRPEAPGQSMSMVAGSGAADGTLRPGGMMDQMATPKEKKQATNIFWLKGLRYNLQRIISQGSGEGDVFLVRGEDRQDDEILKVYYPSFDVNKDLQKAIHSMHCEFVIDLRDFGKTYVDGKMRNYELMEYMQGGTLQEYELGGDMQAFRRITLQAAGAMAYCHKLGVLHKDIKPANFFFRDKEHTQLVLGDFGISSIAAAGTTAHRTTQARTPIFAAPEMYADVIDGVVDVTPAADFYSLGMTLFTLWLGETPLNANERIMMRQKNEGRLPRLGELPDNVRHLVQGLTAVNAQTRWGYEEVERWFKGENVKVDISSPYLKYKSFIMDPDRNQVADNVQELVPMLADNERLATQYLYNGRIKGWLEECGNQKLATIVGDIVTRRYPDDQHAGLWAAIYAMAPDRPYSDIKGNKCSSVHEVALSVMAYWEEYALLMRQPNNEVFLYLEAHARCDMRQLRSYFTGDAPTRHDMLTSVMKAVYEMDPDMPFLMNRPSGTIEQIALAFGSGEMNDDEWQSLCDGRLLAWVHSHSDQMACEQLRLLTEGKPYTRNLAYQVLYNMDRKAAYDLQDVNTPERLGRYIEQRLQRLQYASEQEVADALTDLTDLKGRLAYWLELRGWNDLLADHRNTFDMTSRENRERLGAYDLLTASYRFTRQLGCDPAYRLKDGQLLTDGRHMEHRLDSQRRQLLDEQRKGSLAQWLACYFHEDPTRDFSQPYSYENELVAWLTVLGQIDPANHYYKRYVEARDETAARITQVKDAWKTARRQQLSWQGMFYALCVAWMVVVLYFGISHPQQVLDRWLYTIVLPLGTTTGIIATTRAYFKGYGAMLSFLAGLAFGATSYLVVLTMQWTQTHFPGMMKAVVAVITLIYIGICHLSSFKGESKTDKQLVDSVLQDDVKSTLIEPLVYTFKQRSFKFKGSKFTLLDDASNQIESYKGESMIHYMLWSLLVIVMLVTRFVAPKMF